MVNAVRVGDLCRKAARSHLTDPRQNLAIITTHSNIILQLQVLPSSSRDPESPFYLLSTSFDGRTMVHLVTIPFGVIPNPVATPSAVVRSRQLNVRTGCTSIHASDHYVAIAPPPGQVQTRFFTHGAKCEFKSLIGATGTEEPEDGLCPAGSLKIPWMKRLNVVRIAGRDRLVVLGATKEHSSTLGIFRFD